MERVLTLKESNFFDGIIVDLVLFELFIRFRRY